MFRFVEASKEWKERGTGDVRFLRHKEDKKIRVLMRAEKTLRVRANHPRQYHSIPLSPSQLSPPPPTPFTRSLPTCCLPLSVSPSLPFSLKPSLAPPLAPPLAASLYS